MTDAGWLIMTTSVVSVAAWCGYCMYRVLTLPPHMAEEHIPARLEIDVVDE